MPKQLEQRFDAGPARRTQVVANERPRFEKLAETTLTTEEVLAAVTDYVATAAKGGAFAPRDDVVVRLQMMQDALAREQSLSSKPTTKRKKKSK